MTSSLYTRPGDVRLGVYFDPRIPQPTPYTRAIYESRTLWRRYLGELCRAQRHRRFLARQFHGDLRVQALAQFGRHRAGMIRLARHWRGQFFEMKAREADWLRSRMVEAEGQAA